MKAPKNPTLDYENQLWQQGYTRVAGVDEAGRGPLAGPVVAAAVILPADLKRQQFAGIRDSKELTGEAREHLYARIIQLVQTYAIAQASPKEIDTLNIRQATLLAMKRAVEKLKIKPDYVLIDGWDAPGVAPPCQTIIDGDALSLSIGAASILAKVVRDRVMAALDQSDPRYGLRYHKGYGTQYHRSAITLFGARPDHRASFGGVKEHLTPPRTNKLFDAMLDKLNTLNTTETLKAFITGLEHTTLTDTERFYLRQTAKYRIDDLKHQQRASKPATTDTGKKYEHMAETLMTEKGYTIWERNYKVQGGEIDLICNRGSEIVFVEVKSKTGTGFGQPYEMVTPKKQQALMQTAERYLYERDLTQGWDIRYDVISILAPKNKPPEINHFENAFMAGF